MRSALTFLFIFVLKLQAHSQNKAIELYDLFYAFAPDSMQHTPAIQWDALNNPSITVNWINPSSTLTANGHSRKGTALLSVYNKTFSCGANNTPCASKLYVEGNKEGYTKFTVDFGISAGLKPEQSISFLFNQHLKYRLYKKNADTMGITMSTYEIKMKGKRPWWLVYSTVSTPKGNGIYLKAYFIEEDLSELEKKNTTPAATNVSDHKLTNAAASLFKNINTSISNADKNDIQKMSGFSKNNDDLHIYPTDLNNDGIEEIFIQDCDITMYGNAGCGTMIFIKNSSGKYSLQQEAMAPYLLTRPTSNKGYPDLIAGGPGFKFSVFRWDGTQYRQYKNNQESNAADKMIDEVSAAYIKGKAALNTPDKKMPVQSGTEKTSGNLGSNSSLDYLREYASTQKDIFANAAFVARIKKLMGKELKWVKDYWEMTLPVVVENGLFYQWGMQRHNGGYNEATILADINKNTLYVQLLKEGKTYYFAEDGQKSIPAYLSKWATEVSNRGK